MSSKIPFVNLRTFSHYSMLLAIGTPEEHMRAAQEAGHSGVAITDNASLAGAIQLWKLSKEKGFPVVIGTQLYVTEDLNVKDPNHKYDRLMVYVKDWDGYQNLCRLVTLSSEVDHLYYRPRISFAELFKYKKGLMVSTSDLTSPFGHAILNETGEVKKLIATFKEEFGDDLFCEISLADASQRWNKDLRSFVPEENKQAIVNMAMLELAEEFGIEPYLAMPSYMPKKEQYTIQNIVISNSPTGKDGWHFHEPQYTMSVDEMRVRAQKIAPYISNPQFEQLCINTTRILDKAKAFKPLFKPLLLKIKYQDHPVSKNPELEEKLVLMEDYFKNVDPEFVELLQLSRRNEGINKACDLFPELKQHLDEFRSDEALRVTLKVLFDLGKVDFEDPVQRARITQELKVIQRNGVFRFCDYFLPLEDVVRFHRENGFERGWGRGSGGSSLICYGMDISDVDPIKYVLDPDRFVTKERLGRFLFDLKEIEGKTD